MYSISIHRNIHFFMMCGNKTGKNHIFTSYLFFNQNFLEGVVLFVRSLVPLFQTFGDDCPGFQNHLNHLACKLHYMCTVDSSDSPLAPLIWRIVLEWSQELLFVRWEKAVNGRITNRPITITQTEVLRMHGATPADILAAGIAFHISQGLISDLQQGSGPMKYTVSSKS